MKKSPHDIVALSAVRTPIGKFGGKLGKTAVYHLGAEAIREAIRRAKIPAAGIDECVMGCCRQAGNGTNPARTAARFARLPASVAATTITMACASGLRAVEMAAAALASRGASMAAAGGMESMSTIPYLLPGMRFEGYRLGHKPVYDGWHDSRDPFLGDQTTGETIEALAKKHGITRLEQDQFALESHEKAARAQAKNYFDGEIVNLAEIARDETIRQDCSLKKLSELKPAFTESGTLTPGNSSPLADCAAALILTTRQKAGEMRGTPLFRIISLASRGVENDEMGTGPSVALPLALHKASMRLSDLDVLEINEPFAAAALVNERILRWDRKKVNPWGGAIALGHPVGAAGARILVTLYSILKKLNLAFGGAAIAGAGGVASAIIIEREN